MTEGVGGRTARPVLRPITVRPVPETRPPAVVRAERRPRPGSLGWAPEEESATPYVQDALAVDFDSVEERREFGPQPTASDLLPEPRLWAGRIAQALVEVMAGSRPAPQVLRWTTSEVYAVVARRAAVAARRRDGQRHRAVVRRVLICEPAEGVAEASVVVVDGTRVRALALRLVGQDGRWRVEALHVG